MRTPYRPSSAATFLVSPRTACFELVYAWDATPPTLEQTLPRLIMLPLCDGIMARAACLVPRKTPVRFTLTTFSKSALSLSNILALLGFPCLSTAVAMAFLMSDSLDTSQCTKDAVSGPRSLHTDLPKSSRMSAIMTLAPCFENSLAVDSPMPPAPPVITATFPSSLNRKIIIANFIYMCLCQYVDV
ncbi:hypothetical protein EUGRSUZ_C03990 [Eucalyptus grandis]|uniref:Uncharacterized protein n=2 Tax=Eucalyptus grandis TaxID=71139 RepID=A0A059CW54_EUCGR|nr:hypothetical protein EUGRSUZ_C03990 [Eucalyptus grandis]